MAPKAMTWESCLTCRDRVRYHQYQLFRGYRYRRYVLTLFEEHSAEELPNFLDLMTHLAERGIPCPYPVKNIAGQALGELNGKPAALVSCLAGKSLDNPSPQHCAAIGEVLCAHASCRCLVRGQHYQPALPALAHCTVAKVGAFPGCGKPAACWMRNSSSNRRSTTSALSRGVIHADLFRDNVLMDGDKVGGVTGFLLRLERCAVLRHCDCGNTTGASTPMARGMSAGYGLFSMPIMQCDPSLKRSMPPGPGCCALPAYASGCRASTTCISPGGRAHPCQGSGYFERILRKAIAAREQLLTMWVDS
nr:Homoserine kinase [Methylobacillus glycogenes]